MNKYIIYCIYMELKEEMKLLKELRNKFIKK